MMEFYGDALPMVNGLQRAPHSRETLSPGSPWLVFGGVLRSLFQQFPERTPCLHNTI